MKNVTILKRAPTSSNVATIPALSAEPVESERTRMSDGVTAVCFPNALAIPSAKHLAADCPRQQLLRDRCLGGGVVRDGLRLQPDQMRAPTTTSSNVRW